MKKAEGIDAALISAARAAANKVPLTQNLSDEALTAILDVAWDAIYAEGYTDGFQDQEGMEIQADVLKQGEWAPRIFIWMDGANEEQADALLDLITDHAHENEPEGVTLTMGAVLSPGKKFFPVRGVTAN